MSIRCHIPRLPRCWVLATVLTAVSGSLWAYDDPEPTGPEIISVYPLAVQRGTNVTLAVRGRVLEGAYAVVFEGQGITARVDRVEEVEAPLPDPETIADQSQAKDARLRVVAQVDVDAQAGVGDHWLRLVTPRGVTNRMELRVVTEPIMREVETAHEIVERAQAIDYPTVLSGSIGVAGEVDMYAIDVERPGRLFLEARPSRGALAKKFRPSIEVLEYRETFFNPQRLTRVVFADRALGSEKIIMDRDPRERESLPVRLFWDVTEAGRYFVRIMCLDGWGAPEYVYQLRICEAAGQLPVEHSRPVGGRWRERVFTRKLGADRLREVWSRGLWQEEVPHDIEPAVVATDGAQTGQVETVVISPEADISVTAEQEPNGEPAQARAVQIPGIAEGVIQKARDVDVFKFQVASGQKLAFEVETPDATRPEFNPVLKVFDAAGAEQLTSLQRSTSERLQLLAIGAKVISTFEKSGEYYLHVKDVTLRKGRPDFVYRVLIRPQIPHIGNILLETRTRGSEDGRTDPARLNIVAGGAAKLTLMVDHEEGFYIPSNQVAVSLEGLPAGVESLPASSRYKRPALASPLQFADSEKHQPTTERISVVLYARKDAPLTELPAFVDVRCRAVVGGVPAPELAIGRLPVMVLKPHPEQP